MSNLATPRSKPSSWKSLRVWLGLAISLICLYLAFRGIDLNLLAQAMVRVNLWWALPCYLFFFVSYFARVFRWQLLFTPLLVRWNQVLSALSVGYFLSSILPARLGDIARAYLLGRTEKVPVARALSTVVIERLADGISVVIALALLIPFLPKIPEEARAAGLGAALAAVAVLVALLAISWQRARGVAALRRIVGQVSFLQNERLWRSLDSLIDGLEILRTPRPLAGVAFWSATVWVFAAVVNWLGLLAMGLPLGLDAGALVMAVTSLVVIVPSSPGYIGVFHFVTQQTLVQVYGQDPAAALAYAVVIHAFVNLNLILMGLYYVWKEGLSLTQLSSLES